MISQSEFVKHSFSRPSPTRRASRNTLSELVVHQGPALQGFDQAATNPGGAVQADLKSLVRLGDRFVHDPGELPPDNAVRESRSGIV